MKYIIVEIIPTHSNPKFGDVVQISAIKIEDFRVLDRFDYRALKFPTSEFERMLSYDKENFTYTDSNLLQLFKEWCDESVIFYMPDLYTLNYLSDIDNEKVSILSKLDLEYSHEVIDIIMEKYNLAPSNHIVDLLFEALIYNENKEKIEK